MATSYPREAAYSVRRRVSMADSTPVPAIMTFSLASRGDGGLEDFALLVSGEKDGLAGGAEDDDSCGGRAGIVLDVLLELAMVDGAVRVERGGDGGIDSVKKHRSVASRQ